MNVLKTVPYHLEIIGYRNFSFLSMKRLFFGGRNFFYRVEDFAIDKVH